MAILGKLIGGLVGRRIDRRDGSGGAKGMLMGAAAGHVLRRAGPFGLVLGGAYLAKKVYDRRKLARRPTPPAVVPADPYR